MNFRRLFQFVVFAQICMLAFAWVVTADEPLSMKIEMRHGPNGPRKAAVGVPGENLCFGVDIRGLKTSEQGEVKIQTQVEVRNENNDLIKLLGNHEFELKRYLGTGRYWLPVTTSIPTGHGGGKVKLVVAIRDRIADKQIKSEFPITIQKREGAYIANINFARGNIDTSASGRFEVGEVVIVRFHLLGLESTKSVNCALTLHPQGKAEPALELKMPIEVPQVIGIENGYVHGFQFAALEEFCGTVRLTVKDDAGHSHTVDMPLQVNPALGSDDTIFLAERTSSEQKPTKKE